MKKISQKRSVKNNKKFSLSQAEETKVLRKIVDLTHSELDLDLILNEVVKIMTEMTKADSVFIYLFDAAKQNLVLMASKTPHTKELGKVNLKIGEGIAGWVARENKPVAIKKNAYRDRRFKVLTALPEDQYEAILSVPVIYKKKAIGVVNIQHKRPHEYSNGTVKLIDIIAKQVGGVIEHGRLFEEIKKKAGQFDSLTKVSRSVASGPYLDEILNLIVVVTAEMLNSKICSIMLLNEKGDELVIKATQSLSEEYKKKPNIRVDKSISGEAVKTHEAVMVEDVRKEERYSYPDIAVKENLTSMIALPMFLKEKAIGVINVYTQEPHAFSQEEIAVLQIIADQAAVAVESTTLREDALKAKAALETRKLVERAKGILMRMNNLSEEAAYRLIHKKSMDSCRSMKEIAESIILMDEFRK